MKKEIETLKPVGKSCRMQYFYKSVDGHIFFCFADSIEQGRIERKNIGWDAYIEELRNERNSPFILQVETYNSILAGEDCFSISVGYDLKGRNLQTEQELTVNKDFTTITYADGTTDLIADIVPLPEYYKQFHGFTWNIAPVTKHTLNITEKDGVIIYSGFREALLPLILRDLIARGITGFTIDDLKESFDYWCADLKTNTHKDGWNLYHPCGCNDLRFEVYYDITKQSYIA